MAAASLRFSAAPALLLLAAALPQDALDASLLRTKCQTLLADMSAQGHSHFELRAVCRARLPSDVCGSALGLLGRTPWTPATIAATCDRWQTEVAARTRGLAPGRRAQTQGTILETLDQCTQLKAQLGLCTNKTLDECAQHKAQEYPRATQRIINVLNSMYQDATGGGGQTPQRKYQAQGLGAPAGPGAGSWAGLALLSAVSAGAGAMLAVRLRRSPAPSVALAACDEEGSGARGALGE